ncbi:MAG: response regulator transcription factor [Intestinibacter bartlettii]|uniref:response regulator transcription factor n=1 Tax=Intestinibacter bartlettii TaxID=261299 RepID=UPI0026F0E3C7|nr:response regulator transcription factor [Intestinibacter bartlettii]MDO5009410.1 response regulator transcription factor [Intestinibacter bartlettii]
MFSVLVVEDDKELCELYCTVLSDNGYKTYTAENGEIALKILHDHYIDLMICDVMMPKMDGYELTKELRNYGYLLPILMITARGQLMDKKQGFMVGTDDYMVKPVNVNEMLWRIEALLRRSQLVNQRVLQIGETSLDCDTLCLSFKDNSFTLPQKEFFLLYKLASSIGRIFTRIQIIDEIWGLDFEGDGHTLDVHIARLREKLKENDDLEIITVRGLGYKAVNK